jgi:Collagen triple helix repeat (20 copies)
MLSHLRRRLTFANIGVVVALVLATTGGAYAAHTTGQASPTATASKHGKSGGHHYLITSAKQIKPSVLKALRGKNGATGAQGPAGAQGVPGSQGPAGDTGNAGTNGTDGAPGAVGESVTNTEVKTSSATCEHHGGAEFKVGVGPATHACNGQSGFTATLPAGETETGEWAVSGPPKEEQELLGAISFTIPLPEPLDAKQVHFVTETGSEEVVLNESTFEWELVPTTACPGASQEPAAEPGNLCIYTTYKAGLEEVPPGTGVPTAKIDNTGSLFGLGAGAGTTGTVIKVKANTEETNHIGIGTWAVTTPTT